MSTLCKAPSFRWLIADFVLVNSRLFNELEVKLFTLICFALVINMSYMFEQSIMEGDYHMCESL